jgi:hypothetical protein
MCKGRAAGVIRRFFEKWAISAGEGDVVNRIIAKSPSVWIRLFVSTVTAVYLYMFVEWLFFVTKISFLTQMSFSQQLNTYFLAALALALPLLALVLLLAGLQAVIGRKRTGKAILRLAYLIPALVLGSLMLILIDNFTYTVFQLGVVSTIGVARALYALVFIDLTAAAYMVLWRGASHSGSLAQPLGWQTASAALLLVLSIGLAIVRSPAANAGIGSEMPGSGKDATPLPNIILLSGDGLSATHLSLYGYDRDTTPNLRRLMGSALVAENAFSDASNTGGSLTSVLTGRLPMQTHVYYPPDILMGTDSYMHLPGILKRIGYHTVQITDTYYADAYTTNLLSGFDVANGTSEDKTVFSRLAPHVIDGESAYLDFVVLQRLTDRLGHAFYLITMENPYALVTGPGSSLAAQRRIDEALSILDDSTSPVFLQVHLEGTHGEQFFPITTAFSAGETQDRSWMRDFYDDAILDFDNDVKRVFEHLSRTGEISNTIVVVYSDHGMDWDPTARIPLAIWFPGGKPSGKIYQNVQLVDIAPTLLNYLDLGKPDWMNGQSILGRMPERYIVSPTAEVEARPNGYWLARMLPPFYEIGAMNLIACDRWFTLHLRDPGLEYGDVVGSTGSCVKSVPPSPEEAMAILLGNLSSNGYDTSAFPRHVPISSVSGR